MFFVLGEERCIGSKRNAPNIPHFVCVEWRGNGTRVVVDHNVLVIERARVDDGRYQERVGNYRGGRGEFTAENVPFAVEKLNGVSCVNEMEPMFLSLAGFVMNEAVVFERGM